MKNLRIKYTEHLYRENHLISVKSFTSKSTGAIYKVLLDLDNYIYLIRNEKNKLFIFESKKYGNLNVLKRNARSKLKKLGVEIGKEIRIRTFGICKKGYTEEEHSKQ
jgi:hypothetical protein